MGTAAARIATPAMTTQKAGRSGNWTPSPLREEHMASGFARVANKQLEYLWRDESSAVESRVEAWIKRNSWGYNSLEAVIPLGSKREEGGRLIHRYRPARQTDIAEALKRLPSHVSEAVMALKRRGYLENRKDVLQLALGPKPNPDLPTRPYTGGADPGSRKFALFRGQITRLTSSKDFANHCQKHPKALDQEIKRLTEFREKTTKNSNYEAEEKVPEFGNSKKVSEGRRGPAELGFKSEEAAISSPKVPEAGKPTLSKKSLAGAAHSRPEPSPDLILYLQKNATRIFGARLKRGCDRSIAIQTARALNGVNPTKFFDWVYATSPEYRTYAVLPKLAATFAASLDLSEVDPLPPPRLITRGEERMQENRQRLREAL